MMWAFEKVHLFKRSSCTFVPAFCRWVVPFPRDFPAMTSQTVNAPDPGGSSFCFLWVRKILIVLFLCMGLRLETSNSRLTSMSIGSVVR